LAVDHLDALVPQRRQDGHLDDVHAHRTGAQTVLVEHLGHLPGDLLGDASLGVEGTAQSGDAGAGPVRPVQPRVVELVVSGGRAEVPDDRLPAARQHGEADQLVHRPGADVRGRHIPDVGEVECQQGSQIRTLQCGLEPGEPILSEATEVDPLLPVHRVRAVGSNRHAVTPIHVSGNLWPT
jgi:hypothetical protein